MGAEAGGMIAGGILTASQAAQANSYRREARQYAKTPRPKYEIPLALQQYLAATRNRANLYGLPGQGQMESKIAAASAGGIQAYRQSQQTPSGMAAGIAALDQNTKNAYGDVGVKAVQFQNTNQGFYNNALQAMGNEQKQQWSQDKQSPYLNAMAAAAKLNAAADEKTQQATNSMASTMSMGGSMMGGMGGLGNKTTMATTNYGYDAPPTEQPYDGTPYNTNYGQVPYANNGYGQIPWEQTYK